MIEFEGRTEDEAVQKACSALTVRDDQLDHTVLDEGSSGLVGLRSRPVRIRAQAPREERSTTTETASASRSENVTGAMEDQVEAAAPTETDEEETRGGIV